MLSTFSSEWLRGDEHHLWDPQGKKFLQDLVFSSCSTQMSSQPGNRDKLHQRAGFAGQTSKGVIHRGADLSCDACLSWFDRWLKFRQIRSCKLVLDHKRIERQVSNVYMWPLFFCIRYEGRLGSCSPPTQCSLRGFVTASIHHLDMGALTETARPDSVSGWWHICHSTQRGVLQPYHSPITVMCQAAQIRLPPP